MTDFFYLASQSPRRREILDKLHAPYRLLNLIEGPGREADFEETQIPGEKPVDYVKRISTTKADAAWKHLSDNQLQAAPILTADTTVCINDTILGKPNDAQEARLMLEILSGKEHQVLTAINMKNGDNVQQKLSKTTVSMRQITTNEIEAYIKTDEPFGKAGSYGIQGIASIFISHIAGTYSGVVGLPIYETSELMKHFGFSLL